MGVSSLLHLVQPILEELALPAVAMHFEPLQLAGTTIQGSFLGDAKMYGKAVVLGFGRKVAEEEEIAVNHFFGHFAAEPLQKPEL
ncbi:hypothetical protein PCASD_13295 [Puccinia coronata f. sp. avenae]|uniref:Uncharacterized protein n=1 Tax=Puccinia coronata f. sp. avenae TaxID=200324 RepID=A0A2N5TA31_9BASI|nr:hypothetical protein PCASD_15296 [Puccinia coronata f. sp. avenae]PLW34178.1 hypothetical protein PCASD_13295 [Puccinia coronata f. sp. avenae]